MAVKILIERKITPGRESEVRELTSKLRSMAIEAPGYISGQTLRSVEDPTIHLVISTWRSIEDWNSWLATSQRRALQENMDFMLEHPPRIAIYEHEAFTDLLNERISDLQFIEGE
jgi:heme-degrading monooxygenase HmoA